MEKSISRFARNTRDLLELVERLRKKEVGFVSQKEAIDTATPTGKFMLTVFGAVAELEREYILQRQREGIEIAKRHGKYTGRQPVVHPDFDKVTAQWRRGELTAVQAMKRLTEELFRYSVVVSEETLAREPVDLRRAVEEALLSFYGALEGRGIEPQVRLPEEKVERLLDPAALSRVLGNILTNALKYSAGDLEVTLEERGRLTFSNAAPGLDPVTAGRLFDRFYTVETASAGSTGLGLSIARALTGQMGGSIDAVYEDGILSVRVFFHSEDSSQKSSPVSAISRESNSFISSSLIS